VRSLIDTLHQTDCRAQETIRPVHAFPKNTFQRTHGYVVRRELSYENGSLMNRAFGISLPSIALLVALFGSSQAQPQTFPEFPDTPNPGGESGGGDKVPYIPHKEWLLGVPHIYGVRMWNRRLHYSFRASGPVMRWNIIWSRPGKTSEHSLWFDGKTPKNYAEYSIDEPITWDTDYSIKVQAESWRFEGQERHQITPFVEMTFRTPPNPAISDRIDANESRPIPAANVGSKKTLAEQRTTTSIAQSSKTAAASVGGSQSTTQASRSAGYGIVSTDRDARPVAPAPDASTPPPHRWTICDAARAARARNSPAAPNLEAQCLASGGKP
jgi:hypothetical protein